MARSSSAGRGLHAAFTPLHHWLTTPLSQLPNTPATPNLSPVTGYAIAISPRAKSYFLSRQESLLTNSAQTFPTCHIQL
jgi:hypothetical protein